MRSGQMVYYMQPAIRVVPFRKQGVSSNPEGARSYRTFTENHPGCTCFIASVAILFIIVNLLLIGAYVVYWATNSLRVLAGFNRTAHRFDAVCIDRVPILPRQVHLTCIAEREDRHAGMSLYPGVTQERPRAVLGTEHRHRQRPRAQRAARGRSRRPIEHVGGLRSGGMRSPGARGHQSSANRR